MGKRTKNTKNTKKKNTKKKINNHNLRTYNATQQFRMRCERLATSQLTHV